MKKRLFTAGRIAEFVGVSRQAVTKAMNNNCPEAKEGSKWDIMHPKAFEYLKERGVDPTSMTLKSAKERRDPKATKPVSQSQSKKYQSSKGEVAGLHMARSQPLGVDGLPEIDDLPHMTLSDIAKYHGTEEEFRAWVDSYKRVQEAIEKELKNQKTRGEVIDRSFVKSHILSLIEEMNTRLLVDSPSNIVARIYAHCESGDSKEEAEETVRRELSKPIKAAKVQVIKRVGD